ncbi:hypothetical protein J2743_001627 [Methanobacterium petrolearium]|nr:hypothetical protein [Methanobacterium petrolearium]
MEKLFLKLRIILLYQYSGGETGSKRILLVCIIALFIWTMPIYAMDCTNQTSNATTNATNQTEHTRNGINTSSESQDHVVILKTAEAEGYGDIQDLRLHVLEILEQLYLQRYQNQTAQKEEIIEFPDGISNLQSMIRSLIRI